MVEHLAGIKPPGCQFGILPAASCQGAVLSPPQRPCTPPPRRRPSPPRRRDRRERRSRKMARRPPPPNLRAPPASVYPQPTSSKPRHPAAVPHAPVKLGEPPGSELAVAARRGHARARHLGTSRSTRASSLQLAPETSCHSAVSRNRPGRESHPTALSRHRVPSRARTHLAHLAVPAHRARTRRDPARIHAKHSLAHRLALARAPGVPCAAP